MTKIDEFFEKIEAAFKKIWWVLLVPIGLFIVKIFTGNNKQKETKKEVKEIKKEIKAEEKEIKKEKETETKIENEIEKDVEDIQKTVDEKKKNDQGISQFLPGVKK